LVTRKRNFEYSTSEKGYFVKFQMVVFFLTFAIFLNGAQANQLPAASRIATVVSVSGNVWDVSGLKQKLLLTVGTLLKPKTIIETDAHGTAILKLGTDVAIQVKPNSRFTIDLNQVEDWSVKLKSGAILSAVKNPEKRKDHFKIITRSATIGVRGTAFYVKQLPGKPTYLCTCHGTIEVKDAQGKVLKSITSTHHDHPVTITASMKQVPMDSEHTDAEVLALENTL
jgi:ferric-dicitrate binding protein FerR (iron transport regulator)